MGASSSSRPAISGSAPDTPKGGSAHAPASFFSPHEHAARTATSFRQAGNIRDEPDKHRALASPRAMRRSRAFGLERLEQHLRPALPSSARMRASSNPCPVWAHPPKRPSSGYARSCALRSPARRRRIGTFTSAMASRGRVGTRLLPRRRARSLKSPLGGVGQSCYYRGLGG